MGCSASSPLPVETEDYFNNFKREGVELKEEKYKFNVDGDRRFNIVSWIPAALSPDQYKGVVLISHGMHEQALRYNEVANALSLQVNYFIFKSQTEGGNVNLNRFIN